jgi:transposase
VLKGTKPTAAQLVKRDGRSFMHIQIGGEAPEPIEPSEFLGVDLGIAKIATTSDAQGHSGKPVEKIRRKHNLQRKRLQRQGTKGAKKKLRRLSSLRESPSRISVCMLKIIPFLPVDLRRAGDVRARIQ